MKVRAILAVLMFVSSLILLTTMALFLSYFLDVYPPSHIASYGPHVPAFSVAISQQVTGYPACLLVAAAGSVAVAIFYWLGSHPPVTKTFVASILATINSMLAAYFAFTVLIAYFLLPKLANGP